MSDIYDWSLTASENGGVDSLINWSEGQAPHTVNDSARGMMQRVRECLLESGGALESTFVVDWERLQTTISLKSKGSFRAYKNDRVLRFRSSGWNIGETKVLVDHLSSQAIYKATESGLFPLTGGEIQQGCIYSLVYDEELSGWQLLNPTIIKVGPFRRLPTGFIGAFAMESLPAGWLLCDGRAYSRDHYRDLFATIGTLWGEGDGATTFHVPDFRGMFLRGYDYLGSVDQGRRFASTQQCSLRDHEHSLGVTVSSESSLSRRKRAVEEECVGLSGDALELCNQVFDEATQTDPLQEISPLRRAAYTSHPFFIKYDNMLSVYITPKRFGEDLGEHNHIVMMESYGEEETRPINVSVVFGIKT